MKSKTILVVQNSKGKLLSSRETRSGHEFVWVSELADVSDECMFSPALIRLGYRTKPGEFSILDHFPEYNHDMLIKKGASRAKWVTYDVSYKVSYKKVA